MAQGVVVCIQYQDILQIVLFEQFDQETPQKQLSDRFAKRNETQCRAKALSCSNYPGLDWRFDLHNVDIVTEDFPRNVVQVPDGQNAGMVIFAVRIQYYRHQVAEQVMIIVPNPIAAIEWIQQDGSVRLEGFHFVPKGEYRNNGIVVARFKMPCINKIYPIRLEVCCGGSAKPGLGIAGLQRRGLCYTSHP